MGTESPPDTPSLPPRSKHIHGAGDLSRHQCAVPSKDQTGFFPRRDRGHLPIGTDYDPLREGAGADLSDDLPLAEQGGGGRTGGLSLNLVRDLESLRLRGKRLEGPQLLRPQ